MDSPLHFRENVQRRPILQINAYTVALLVAALVSGGLSYYAWKRRYVTAGAELAFLMLAVALWAFFQFLESTVTGRGAKMFFSATSYVGSQATPVLFLVFALRYTQEDEWITPRRVALLFVIPLASLVIAYTSGVQHILWRSVTLTHTHAGVTAIYSHGPWYFIEVAYGYLLIAIGIFLLVRAVFRFPGVYSRQARLLILATLIPLVGHIIYTFSPSSVQGIDVTPIVFTLTGVLVALAVFRYKLLDLRPIASRVLYEGIGDAMIAIDVENRVVDINAAAQGLIDSPADEVVGKPADDVFAKLPSLASQIPADSKATRSKVEVENSGGLTNYDMRTWPLRDRRQHLLGKLVTLHDVTEMRRAEEELRRINAELDVYARTVSHDLKLPLAALRLAGESLDRLLSMPETEERNFNVEKLVEIIVRNTDKADSLVSGLLLLAEAGQKPVDVMDVPVDAVVRRVVDELRDEIDVRHARIEYEDLGSVRADPTHIYQLFANLVNNSVTHNAASDPATTIKRFPSDKGTNRFLVRDNGWGIADKDLDNIFKPFFKGDGGGTGVGLATVARIVQVYGGEIRAYNDEGACFEFTIKDYETA
jgi:PAS domain S-box-containing protein